MLEFGGTFWLEQQTGLCFFFAFRDGITPPPENKNKNSLGFSSFKWYQMSTPKWKKYPDTLPRGCFCEGGVTFLDRVSLFVCLEM